MTYLTTICRQSCTNLRNTLSATKQTSQKSVHVAKYIVKWIEAKTVSSPPSPHEYHPHYRVRERVGPTIFTTISVAYFLLFLAL